MPDILHSVVTVQCNNRAIKVSQPAPPKLEVLALGRQGPVGTLSPEILQRLEQAITVAGEAKDEAQTATQSAAAAAASVDSLIDDLTTSFTFYTGAISAQEDSTS